MSTATRLALDSPAAHVIRVQGYLDSNRSDYYGGAIIQVQSQSPDAPVTVLRGDFRDQATLAGVLNTLYDLGLPLLSLERLAAEPQSMS